MTVFLVGAGPGEADLLTLGAAQLLARADAVVHDRLIGDEVLHLINTNAVRFDVGKSPGRSNTQETINELLVSLAQKYDCVVRLKGGDSFVFGRGGEEAQALVANGIDVEVVPGVTSAFAAPALAGIPITHRTLAHGVTVVTGSTVQGAPVDFARLANADLTLVVLMGVERRAAIANQLQRGGLAPTTPVAVIESASTKHQRCVRATLQDLGDLEVRAPAVIVIGAVAALEVGVIGDFACAFASSR